MWFDQQTLMNKLFMSLKKTPISLEMAELYEFEKYHNWKNTLYFCTIIFRTNGFRIPRLLAQRQQEFTKVFMWTLNNTLEQSY